MRKKARAPVLVTRCWLVLGSARWQPQAARQLWPTSPPVRALIKMRAPLMCIPPCAMRKKNLVS